MEGFVTVKATDTDILLSPKKTEFIKFQEKVLKQHYRIIRRTKFRSPDGWLWEDRKFRARYRDSYSKGGRVYNGIQNRPVQTKRFWKLKREPVVFLDYNNQIVRIFHYLIGEECPDIIDFYRSIPEIDRYDEKLAWIQAIRFGRYEVETKSKPIIEKIKTLYPNLALHFHRFNKRDIQNVDGRIITYVIDELNSKGIPCIPLHDGAFVPASELENLRAAMIYAANKVLGPGPVHLTQKV